jgi:peptidylprolyl isomerase
MRKLFFVIAILMLAFLAACPKDMPGDEEFSGAKQTPMAQPSAPEGGVTTSATPPAEGTQPAPPAEGQGPLAPAPEGPVAPGAEQPKGDETVTTPSGLKYIDLAVGTGEKVASGDNIKVLYVGTLENGTEFDAARDPNNPLVFTVGIGKVIKGWDEGLVGMSVGGKRKLIIPPDLAYGARQVGPIPPNSTLIFEVELLDIVK